MKLYLFLVFAMLTNCSSEPTKKSESKGAGPADAADTNNSEDSGDIADTGSDEPADVNALFLTLTCVSHGSNQDKGKYQAQCKVVNKDGVSLNPDKFSDSYKWSVVGGVADANLVISETNDEDGYAANISVGEADFLPLEILTSLEIKLDYVDSSSKIATTLKSRMIEMYAGMANQKYFRFVLFSIKDHDPTSTVQYLTSIEIKIDGAWSALKMDNLGLLSLGGEPVPTNGNINDIGVFRNIFGLNTPPLRASALERFTNNPPLYEAIEPLRLSFGDGMPRSVTGFRYNGGSPLVNKNVAAGFPDSFQFETSSDQTSWTVVKGSKIDIESINDQDVFEYIWSGFEL